MADTPWLGDACSLVDAFRAGELSPAEALDASLAAIDESKVNAFSYVAREEARAAAEKADVSLPFGGVLWPSRSCSGSTGGRSRRRRCSSRTTRQMSTGPRSPGFVKRGPF